MVYKVFFLEDISHRISQIINTLLQADRFWSGRPHRLTNLIRRVTACKVKRRFGQSLCVRACVRVNSHRCVRSVQSVTLTEGLLVAANTEVGLEWKLGGTNDTVHSQWRQSNRGKGLGEINSGKSREGLL